MTYLMDKMFNLILKYKIFRISLFATVALFFLIFGLFEMSEYFAGEDLESSRFFPFFLGLSAVLIYFSFWAYKDPRQEEQ